MNLAITLRSELLKSKRTSAFYLTVFGGLLVPSIKLIWLLTSGDPLEDFYTDPWHIYYKNGLHLMIGLILPLYTVLITTILAQIEYRNNTWKQVFSSPQSELALFISKFLNLQLMIVLFQLINVVFLFVVVIWFNAIEPKLDLLHQPFNWQHLIEMLSKTFILNMAIGSIQFWISLRFRNFIIPLAIGFTFWFLGLMFIFEYKSMSKEWYPFSYMMMLIMPQHQDLHLTLLRNALLFSTMFLTAGFLDFKRRRGKG